MITNLSPWAVEIRLHRRRGAAVLLLILLVVGLLSALQSISRPFWYDEIYTVDISRLQGAREIWRALDDAVDVMPPVFYMTEKAARLLVPDDHLGYRLPSLLGLLGTICCVYWILSRRVDFMAALLGGVFVLCTTLPYYASDARPYTLLVACVSCAVLAWQRIDDSQVWCLLLVFMLAYALSLHYYAVLAWPAFILAEASVWYFRRRFRASVWAALVVGAAPLLLFSKLLLRCRAYYGKTFWSKPKLALAITDYDTIFKMAEFKGWILAAGLTIAVAYLLLRKARLQGPKNLKTESNDIPVEEFILVVSLLWLPFVGHTVALLGHGGMSARYAMPTIIGAALALGYLASGWSGWVKILLLALFLTHYGLDSKADVKSVLKGSLVGQRAASAERVRMITQRYPDLRIPIVVSSGLQYLPLAYYTPVDADRNLYALVDPRSALIFQGSDSVDLNLTIMRPYFPVKVEDYAAFVSQHKEFLLVSNGDEWDWWPARLAHDGENLALLDQTGSMRVYRVTLKP